MLLISHKEDSGRKMYLTDCMGTYFWSPCKTIAKQFDEAIVAREVFELDKNISSKKFVEVEKAVMYIPYFSLEHPGGLMDTLFIGEEDDLEYFEPQKTDFTRSFDSAQIANKFVDKLKFFPPGRYWVLEFREEPILQ